MAGGLLSGIAAVVAAAVAALGAASSGGATPPGPATAGGCHPAGARTLARDSVARVFEIFSPASGAAPTRGPQLGGTAVYACYYKRGRPVALGGAGMTRVGPVALAGPVVAYATTAMGVDTSSSAVAVLNLSTGTRHILQSASPPRRPESFTSVSGLVATARGSAAWIAARSAIGQPQPVYEVRRFQSPAAETLLDSGPAIAPGSLRRTGSGVTWTDSGRRRSATLR